VAPIKRDARILSLARPSLLVAALLCLAFLAGCGGAVKVGKGRVETPYTRYSFTPPGPDWRIMEVKDGNVAYYHAGTTAVITLNSTCKEYRDATPAVLTGHLLMGIEHRQVHGQQEVEIAGRTGLATDVSGALDGVKSRMLLTVFNRDYCTYDILLACPPESFEQVKGTVQHIVSSFRVEHSR